MAIQKLEERQLELIGEDWHYVGESGEIPFYSTSSNYDTVNYTAGAFYKDPSGIVWLKGLVKPATTGVGGYVFILPEGYRPALIRHFVTLSATAMPAPLIRIFPGGEVEVYRGSTTWTCLDTINFRAEN